MVAMSGGVDSSVAAALLQDQGYPVVGATLRLFSNDDIGILDRTRTCCSLDDVADARSVAWRLGIQHYVFNFGQAFNQEVINRFAEGYRRGETPNPCIDCNRFIKFSRFLDRARLLDIDRMATGHYARTAYDEKTGRHLLLKARDTAKDQTYVLYALTQSELASIHFPLGEFSKKEVRAMAESRGLVNARKPDSQDICFVPDGNYVKFLENIVGIPPKPGNFIDRTGTVLGIHQGLIHYTIGQRKGLGICANKPLYVIKKNVTQNTVTLGGEDELYTTEMTVGDVNLISITSLTKPMAAMVKIRYSHQEAPAMLLPLPFNRIRVMFDLPQRAVTPGQAAVFYIGESVLGGGTIEQKTDVS